MTTDPTTLGTAPAAESELTVTLNDEERTLPAGTTCRWLVEQILEDPDGDRDWRLYAEVDLAASDEEGDLVLVVVDMDRATIDHG